MACPHQRTAFARNQREHMSGGDNVLMILGRVDGDGDCPGTVMGRNARRDAIFRFNGDREGRSHAFPIVPGHHVEVQRMRTLLAHRQADQAPAMACHEVHMFRRGKIGRNDQVALILPVLCIDQDIHPAIAGIFDDLVNRGDCLMEFAAHSAYCPSGASAPIIRAT